MTDNPTNAEVMRAIGRVEGKVDGLTTSLANQSKQSSQDLAQHRIRLDAYSNRLRKVERGQSRIVGGVAVAATGVSAAITVVLKKAGLL